MNEVSAPPNERPNQTRRVGGRPPFVVTEQHRDFVRKARANGVAVKTIARLLSINLRTLTRHFRAELAHGHEDLVAAIGNVVIDAALSGNVYAAFQWLSRHGGEQWRKVEGRLHGGLEGAPPINMNQGRVVIVELPPNGRTDISPEELEAEVETETP